MPRRELKSGRQIVEWLADLSGRLRRPGEMILIGSAALLWHAEQRGIVTELPEAGMDADALTDSDEIVEACYDCLIGSEFERTHGWHVHLMPHAVLREFPADWRSLAAVVATGQLTLVVPQPMDLLAPKLKRGEPRDQRHFEWAARIGLIAADSRSATESPKPMTTEHGILYHDHARLEYGRMLWKHAGPRERLLHRWNDPRHPHSERFREWRPEVERVLSTSPESDAMLDRDLRQRGLSLRVAVKEIPSVFGDFF